MDGAAGPQRRHTMTLSVIIPALNEPYLRKTMHSVAENATGDVEILVVDGEGESRPKVNAAIEKCSGEFVLKLDAHCMLAKGFDAALIAAHQDKRVQVPRRKRLDAKNWTVIEDGRPPIDYEFILFEQLVTNKFIWGTTWEERTLNRAHILVDDTMHMQGSCYFMSKRWFKECGFLDMKYGGFAQESEEIVFETIKRGGEVKVNKNTWYAHLHKTPEERAWFQMPSLKQGYNYSYQRWVIEHQPLFDEFVDRFMPIPTWPDNWQRILYPHTYL